MEIQRSKPRSEIIFPVPLVGPSGAKLISYVWKWKNETMPSVRGEIVEKRVSNWSESIENNLTGREIVHQYNVDGNFVSAESAMKLLGFTASTGQLFVSMRNTVQALAKLQMKLAKHNTDWLKWQTDWNSVCAHKTPEIITSDWEERAGCQARRVAINDYIYEYQFRGEFSDDQVIRRLTENWREDLMRILGWSYMYRTKGRAENNHEIESSNLRKKIDKAQAKLATISVLL